AVSAASHTGNLAGSNEAYHGIFQKYGVIAVDDFDQLMTMAHTLSILNGNLPLSPAYGGLALSGGENTLFADIGTTIGLELPPFAPETRARLEAHIPHFATPHNPCDTTTHLFYNEQAIHGVLTAVDADPNVGATFISVNINQEETPIWQHFCRSVAEAKKSCSKPVLAIPASEGSRNKRLRRLLEVEGIPMMASPATSLKCLRYLADFICYKAEDRTLLPAAHHEEPDSSNWSARTEADSKNVLCRFGIPIPKGTLIQQESELIQAMEGLAPPYVMKINSPDVQHKSDVGGVRLNIQSRSEATAAYNDIIQKIHLAKPEAAINGILFEEMLPPGLELILGVKNDPQLGPMLLIGLGGIFVEVMEDIAVYPAPLSRSEAIGMLRGLKAYPLLEGVRGNRPCDLEALVSMMVNVGEFAYQHRATVKEIDLNPVFVYGEGGGAVAVDALVIEYAAAPANVPAN
ncbi:MAG: acetate--CoA ligase family protein, partial [Anaerolineales bacterium]|nr:acetate--CoA ligase family protein [Anaerolineales bacterium]